MAVVYTALFLLLGLILGASYPRKLGYVAAFSFFVRTLVPVQAVGPVFFKLNPGASIMIGAFLSWVIFHTPQARRVVEYYVPSILFAIALTGYVCLDILGGSSLSSDLGATVQIIWLPLMFVFAIAWSGAQDPRQLRVLVWTVVASAVLQVLLSQMQLDQKRAIWWENAYDTSWWFSTKGELTRAMGTTGNPLQLGLLMAAAAPLLLLINRVWVRALIFPILVYGTLQGNARTSLAIVALSGVIVIADSFRKNAFQTVIFVPLGVAIFQWIVSKNSALVEMLTNKLQNDNGSTQKRQEAAQWFLDHLDHYMWLGFQGSRDLRGTGVLRSSIENGYFKAAMSFGVMFAVLYVVFCLAFVIKPFIVSRDSFPWVWSGLGLLVGFASTGSFMDGGLEGTTLWVVLGGAAGVAMQRTFQRQAEVEVARERAIASGAGLATWQRKLRGVPM